MQDCSFVNARVHSRQKRAVATTAVAMAAPRNYPRNLSENIKLITPGVRSMFLSTLAFFAANVCVKQVAHIPAMETVFFRCSVATVICVYGLRRAKGSLIGSNHTTLLLRGLFGTT